MPHHLAAEPETDEHARHHCSLLRKRLARTAHVQLLEHTGAWRCRYPSGKHTEVKVHLHVSNAWTTAGKSKLHFDIKLEYLM